MRSYRNLDIWQKSLEILRLVYDLSNKFPESEKYGLTVQIKRAVVSISSNIAEGAGRERDKEFFYFLNIAYGSSYELQTQLIICHRLNFISVEVIEPLLSKLEEVQKMIYVFKENINKRII